MKNPNTPDSTYFMVMISNPEGLPVPVGSIEIKTDSLVVEKWMREKVAIKAAKLLTNLVLNSNHRQVLN